MINNKNLKILNYLCNFCTIDSPTNLHFLSSSRCVQKMSFWSTGTFSLNWSLFIAKSSLPFMDQFASWIRTRLKCRTAHCSQIWTCSTAHSSGSVNYCRREHSNKKLQGKIHLMACSVFLGVSWMYCRHTTSLLFYHQHYFEFHYWSRLVLGVLQVILQV